MGMGVADLLHQSSSINGTGAVSVWMVFLSCLCHISILAHLSHLRDQASSTYTVKLRQLSERNAMILRETTLS